MRGALAALVILSAAGVGGAQAATYRQSADKSCDGYRRLDIPTAPGTCISLIAENLGFPRGVLTLSDTQVLVADMGSWERGRGRLLLVEPSPTGDAPKITVLATRLDRPHGLARGPDGRIWLGEATRISEVKLGASSAQLTTVLIEAPGTGRHPLIGLAVMNDGRIAFSTGSASDDCDGAMQGGVCQESTGPLARATIRVLAPTSTPVKWRDIRPFATGLRNSAALTVDPVANVLWGGENGMDIASPTIPPDELNKIELGKHYGWPACYGMAVRARGFAASTCVGTAVPARNLAAHSAPLGLAIVEGGLARNGRAIAITLHGYQPTGHRITLVPINARGDLAGQSRDIVFGWTALRGVRPAGTPVGISSAPNGGLYVTEDGNGTLLRVSVQPE
jgi:glucose/arabinose dehydrogenase